MADDLVFFVNGRKVTETHPDPRATLLRYLRATRLTGSKEGCGEGSCGSCTVMVSRYDRREKVVRHMNVNACLVPLCSLHNMAVTTVEGVGDTRRGLHKIQKCLSEAHSVQCGFCTSGMVMSMYTLLRNMAHPSQEDIQMAIEGNLCRCTGYRSIIEGLTQSAARESSKAFHPPHPSQDVIFPPELQLKEEQDHTVTFGHDGVTWIRPRDLPHLLLLLAENPKARVISGGTTVVLDMKLKHMLPETLVSTNHIPELTCLEVREKHLILGGGLTLEELRTRLPALVRHLPEWKTRSVTALCGALRWLAASQIRNIASLAGNLLNPATVSDLQPLFLAMNADLHVDSAVLGTRTIPYREAMRSSPPLKELASCDVVIFITFPLTQQDDHVMFFKQPERRGFDVSYVSSVPCISLEPGSRTMKNLHVTFGGTAFQPNICMHSLGDEFIGRELSRDMVPNILFEMDDRLTMESHETADASADPRHLAMAHVFKFLYAVLEDSGQGTDSFSLSTSLSNADYHCTRVYDAVSPDQPPEDALRRPIPQFSSEQMTCGEAVFLDDIPRCEDELYSGLVLSTRSHAKIVHVDTSKALALPGVTGYVDYKDVPGENIWGIAIQGEPVFAESEVTFYGQIIGLVVAADRVVAQEAVRQVKVQYEDLPSILTIEDAIETGSYFKEEVANPKIVRGDIDAGFASSDDIIEGDVDIDSREHYYLEPHSVLVMPRPEHGEVEVFCTTQSPTSAQEGVARVLGIPQNRVTCRVKRIGGSFGGKETRNNQLSQPVAVAASKYRLPVRCILDRRTDMKITGKAPRFHAKYKVGYTKDGRIQCLVLDIYVDAGYYSDVAFAVLELCVINFESSYRYPNCRVTGHLCRTNTPPNTAFRGFGIPDVYLVSEVILSKLATRLELSETQVHEVNMLSVGDTTITSTPKDICNLSRCWEQCLEGSRYEARRRDVHDFNSKNQFKKRGIAVVPFRFGIGYKDWFMCQSGALIQVYADGSVLLAHGGTEMGQGLHVKMIQVASHVLGIPASDIHICETSTSTVPNTPSTAASVSSDLNGKAVQAACEEIVKRLEPIKKQYPEKTWKDWVKEAFFRTVNLSAVGYYSSRDRPGFSFSTGQGQCNEYMTFGAGCSEVEVDCLTGETQVLETHLVIDVGRSLNPGIDLGQIEGAFQMGCGAMLLERAVVSEDGCVLKGGPAVYKIPTVRNIPRRMSVSLLKDSDNPCGVFSSKGIGEPAICCASSVYLALKNAILDFRKENGLDVNFDLSVPATAKRVRSVCRDAMKCIIQKTQ